MKVLLLAPSFYTLDKTINLGFTRIGHTVYHHDYRKHNKPWKNRFNTQSFRFPYSIRSKWDNHFMNEINKTHLRVFNIESPDIVLIYNNEMLLPETLKHFKNAKKKILFFLGDNPFYTPTNDYYLALLKYGDLIISPDTFWNHQLLSMGIKNVIFDFPGYNDTLFENINISDEFRDKNKSDVLFIGTGYTDTWGYKRALFVNQFSKLNLKVYGTKHWLKWLSFFPELKNKFTLLSGRLTFDHMCKLMKCSKIYPVDANPGLLNGIHLRVFETIAAGILPLVEYRKDVETVFKPASIPLIKSYSDAQKLAQGYLVNDNRREQLITCLQEFIEKEYKPEKVITRILYNV